MAPKKWSTVKKIAVGGSAAIGLAGGATGIAALAGAFDTEDNEDEDEKEKRDKDPDYKKGKNQ